MGDEIKKENAIPTEVSQKQSAELSTTDLSQATGGAANAFVDFGDIKGESQDDKHKDWIEVLSFNHSITQPKP